MFGAAGQRHLQLAPMQKPETHRRIGLLTHLQRRACRGTLCQHAGLARHFLAKSSTQPRSIHGDGGAFRSNWPSCAASNAAGATPVRSTGAKYARIPRMIGVQALFAAPQLCKPLIAVPPLVVPSLLPSPPSRARRGESLQRPSPVLSRKRLCQLQCKYQRSTSSSARKAV